MDSATGNSGVPSHTAILEETILLLRVFSGVAGDLARLDKLLASHFQEDAKGMEFRSLCCYGRVGEAVSLQLFNQLCILPNTGWGFQLSSEGATICPSALREEQTYAYLSDFAVTVAGILHAILRGVIDVHPEGQLILDFIPTGGIPPTWFQAIIGPVYSTTPFPVPSLPILRRRISHCLDRALQQKPSLRRSTPFFCSESGAYWQEDHDSFDSKKFYLECCSDFPAYLEELLIEKRTTLDKLAGLKEPTSRHYDVEAMVEDAYSRATKQGMEKADLKLSDGTLGGTVFAMHNGMLSAQWVASYLVDTDNNFFMEDVRAKIMNAKERMLRIFSTDHTFHNPTWLQFGSHEKIYLYLSQRASTAEEGWLTIANYVINLLIDYINHRLDADDKGKEFRLERVDYTVGVASIANPAFGLFALHSDAKPGIVDSALAMYSKLMLMVPTLGIQNHCAPTCEISWVGKDDKAERKLASFTHDFVITHWQLMNVNEMFRHQVRIVLLSSSLLPSIHRVFNIVYFHA
jgi:hypothetical protein